MDDHHGRMELSLNQLPLCPYVMHTTVENFVIINIILHVVMFRWLMCFPHGILGWLGI